MIAAAEPTGYRRRIMRSARAFRATAPTVVVYASSLAFLFAGELTIAKATTPQTFGAYQLVRNSLPLLTTIGLLGYDQALVRELARNQAHRPVRFTGSQYRVIGLSVLAALLVSGYLRVALGFDTLVVVVLPVCTFLVSWSVLVGSSMRALGHTANAAFAHQGHRLLTGVALVLVAVSPVKLDMPLFTVLAAAAVVPFWYSCRWIRHAHPLSVIAPQDHKVIRRLGVVFSLAALTMAASDWLDQLIISHSDLGLVGNGSYAVAKLLAVYPLTSIAAILGFVVLAEASRRSATLTVKNFWRWFAVSALVASGLAICAYLVAKPVGTALFGLDLPRFVFPCLAAVGALRLFYVLPGAVLGAIGTTTSILAFGLIGLTALVLQTGISLGVNGRVTLTSVSLGLLVASAFRAVTGVSFCVVLLQRGERA